jgi:hypothetical protein
LGKHRKVTFTALGSSTNHLSSDDQILDSLVKASRLLPHGPRLAGLVDLLPPGFRIILRLSNDLQFKSWRRLEAGTAHLYAAKLKPLLVHDSQGIADIKMYYQGLCEAAEGPSAQSDDTNPRSPTPQLRNPEETELVSPLDPSSKATTEEIPTSKRPSEDSTPPLQTLPTGRDSPDLDSLLRWEPVKGWLQPETPEVINYLNMVESKLGDPDLYAWFLEIMNAYAGRR